jgi:hypothetical protein
LDLFFTNPPLSLSVHLSIAPAHRDRQKATSKDYRHFQKATTKPTFELLVDLKLLCGIKTLNIVQKGKKNNFPKPFFFFQSLHSIAVVDNSKRRLVLYERKKRKEKKKFPQHPGRN